MQNKPLIPVILCGGYGSRLWPLSRESLPKQYLNLSPNNNYTLLQQTIKRLEGLNNLENPIIICNEEHRFIVAEQLREINVSPDCIILEPFGKNTAPAITIAAIKVIEENKDSTLLILSADHLIKNIKKFQKGIQVGLSEIDNDKLITFGIFPTYPETGFGYIKTKEPLDKKDIKAILIEKFYEKPEIELAKQFIKDKKFLWNSGMFMFKASAIIKELKETNLTLLEICKKAFDKDNKDMDFHRLNKKLFNNCPNISIDNAVMEITKNGFVIPLDIGWSDIGNWLSIWENSEKDQNGNATSGKVVKKEVYNSYIRSESKLVAALGLKDLIIVETNDAVLVAHSSYSQQIKDIVNELDLRNYKEAKTHGKIYRPWGNYSSIEEVDKWQIKKIEVKPGESLSLQMHFHRSEHWVVVQGTAKVQIESKVFLLSENQSTFIPKGVKHRLSNPENNSLIVIEVQSGSYLGEDDIVRFEDNYGRLTN